MRRLPRSLSRTIVVVTSAALMSSGALAAAPKPTGPKTVPITMPLSYQATAPTWSSSDERYEAHRRWDRHRHNGGIDGGDVLVGLLVLGGVAAVASAIDKSGDERRERTSGSDYPERPYDYESEDRETSDDWRADSGGQDRYAAAREGRADAPGQDRYAAARQGRAVNACSAEASRSGQVGEIFEAEQVGAEWRVRGEFEGGGEFTCSVDSGGRAYVGLDNPIASAGSRDY